MRLFRTILMSLLLAGSLLPGLRAQPAGAKPTAEAAAQTEVAQPEERGLSPKALPIGSGESSLITSSMVVTWVVALGLIVLTRVATRKMQPVPTGAQNFWEWLVEAQIGRASCR